MRRGLPVLERRPWAPAGVIAFIAMLAVVSAAGSKPFYWDAGSYWRLGNGFVKDGHFSLLNFDSSLRGYAFPLIARGLRELAGIPGWSGTTAVRIFNAAIFSAIATVAAPRLAEVCWPKRRWGVERRLALALVLLVFWSGYLAFPLTDFPALLLVLVALFAVSRSASPAWSVATGAAASLAIDFRPSYIMLAPVVGVLFVWGWWERHREHGADVRRAAACAALLVIGFVVIALPQSLATHRHYRSWSFVPGSAQNLSGFQLSVGMQMQRYETFVGPGKAPQMRYLDRTGSALLSHQDGGAIQGSGQYLGLALTHPVTVAGLFVRHLVNGLDVRYTTPYVEHLATTRERVQRLAGFLLVFLALVRLLWPAARRSLGPAHWRYVVALIATCVTSIPAAMETRFLLPVYLTCYLLVLAPGWPRPAIAAAGWRRLAAPVVVAVAYAVFMLVVWQITSAATDDLRFG